MTVLRPQPWVRPVAPMLALFFAAVVYSGWHSRHDLPAPAAWAVMVIGALLALAMAYAAWSVPRRSVQVSAHDVAFFAADRELYRLRFSDLTEVRPYLTPRRRVVRGPRHAIALRGTTTDGHERTLRFFDLVPGLRPLLDALEPVVAARPELFAGEDQRQLFRLFLVEVQPLSGPPAPRT